MKGIRSDIECPVVTKKIERDLNEVVVLTFMPVKKWEPQILGVGHIDIARNREKCADITTLGSEDQKNIKI